MQSVETRSCKIATDARTNPFAAKPAEAFQYSETIFSVSIFLNLNLVSLLCTVESSVRDMSKRSRVVDDIFTLPMKQNYTFSLHDVAWSVILTTASKNT